MKAMELSGMLYLRLIRRCPLVLLERGPCAGRPDVIGITDRRYCIEIEIKRTMSDFRANGYKSHVLYRELWIERWPKQFFFMVPAEISKKVEAELPEWAGLLTFNGHGIPVVSKDSPNNLKSKRVTMKGAVALARMASNQIMSLAKQLNNERARNGGKHPEIPIDYEI